MSVTLYLSWFPIVFWPLSWFMALLIHEIGHVIVFVVLTQSGSWHIYLGGGKPLFKMSKLTIGANFIMGGKAVFNPSFSISRMKTIFICAGGIFFNVASLAFAIIFFPVFEQLILRYFGLVFTNRYIYIKNYFLVANMLMIAVTIFPCEYRYGLHKGASDGLRIFRLLRNRETL